MRNEATYDDKKYELIFEGSKVGVWEWPDVSKIENIWTDRMYVVLGYNKGEVEPTTESFFGLVHPDDADMLAKALDEHMKHDTTFQVEYRVRQKDNSFKWIQGSGQAIRNKTGEAVQMSGIVLDIDAKKRAEQEVESNLAFMSAAEKAANIGSFKWDPFTGELSFSNGAKILFGLPIDQEMSFEAFFNQVYDEDHDRIKEVMERSKDTLEDIRIGYRVDVGKEVHIEAQCTYFTEEITNKKYYLGILRDKTLEYAQQAKVDALIANLTRSNEDLEQFAYVASHDLQEPLRKIQTFGERLMARSQEMSEKDQNYVERMQGAAGRMQVLIRDLLDFSRASRVVKVSGTVALDKVMHEVVDVLESKINESNAEIQVPKLPQLHGNEGQLYRVFLNLLSNALKFGRANQQLNIKLTYEVVSKKEMKKIGLQKIIFQKYHCIKVIDNGIGFEPEYADKIFVIFQRLHGRSEYAGTGIGLAICRKIITNHGGYIHAEGKHMEGATFSVYLPKNKI